MLVLAPLLIIGLYVAMYILRTEKTGACKWRQVSKDAEGVDWACPVCGASARTVAGEPKHCGGQVPKL
ncbi:hypothetical protein DA792_14060 [Celeribacter baekdonensis]|uniref:Uncharacterized protein n=1 Tax=Celeribacter baekdonensis TaxID=875171 RepID=A0A2R4M4I4_9RHOB|nr:hypothetical protein DA792_14060 [Celeribacter baekdonensis]